MIINQKLNEFANDCTLASQYQILNRNYWVNIKYTVLDKTIDLALKAKVLFKWGAVFETIYNWNAKRISNIIWVELVVDKLSILSDKFASQVNDRVYYGIWLRNWNKKYLEAIKKGVLTTKDIDAISKQWGWFQHNNVWWQEWFDEVYGWLRVKCPYDVLIYWIEKWVFGSVARTFKANPLDNFSILVEKYLKQIHFDPDSEIIVKTNLEKEALNKASEINYKYKING